MWDGLEIKPHLGGHGANTQASARPIRTEQRPNQHKRATLATVSSAWRDSSEPQRPLQASLRLTVLQKFLCPDPPNHGTKTKGMTVAHNECQAMRLQGNTRAKTLRKLANCAEKTMHRVLDVVEFKPHREAVIG